MKLAYRGVFYNYSNTEFKIISGEVTGKYRGINCQFRQLEQMLVSLPTVKLKYRGVTYCNSLTAIQRQLERSHQQFSLN